MSLVKRSTVMTDLPRSAWQVSFRGITSTSSGINKKHFKQENKDLARTGKVQTIQVFGQEVLNYKLSLKQTVTLKLVLAAKSLTCE